jgi:hypothetical protein
VAWPTSCSKAFCWLACALAWRIAERTTLYSVARLTAGPSTDTVGVQVRNRRLAAWETALPRAVSGATMSSQTAWSALCSRPPSLSPPALGLGDDDGDDLEEFMADDLAEKPPVTMLIDGLLDFLWVGQSSDAARAAALLTACRPVLPVPSTTEAYGCRAGTM